MRHGRPDDVGRPHRRLSPQIRSRTAWGNRPSELLVPRVFVAEVGAVVSDQVFVGQEVRFVALVVDGDGSDVVGLAGIAQADGAGWVDQAAAHQPAPGFLSPPRRPVLIR
jgi:hypothetical protein